MPKKKNRYEMFARGSWYRITPKGYIGIGDVKPTNTWKVYGISKHHMKRSPDYKWDEIKKMLDSGKSIEGYFWDVDHGTVRLWGGSWAGKIPKAKLKKVM